MNFFESLSKKERDNYIKYLGIMGSLSRFFSENPSPYLDSRICENLFCKCLNAENLARKDCTADAKKGDIGIGIKTWMGGNLQKIAEFNKARPQYKHLRGLEKAKKIAQLRNDRIDVTMRAYGLKSMIYHVTIREPGLIRILECPLDRIDIDNIRILNDTDSSLSFTDGLNIYSFNNSKSVLMEHFDKLVEKAHVDVNIIADPYPIIEGLLINKNTDTQIANAISSALTPSIEKEKNPFIYLRLYTYKSKKTYEKYVPERSGLNQWNALGRKRDPNELYIPISAEDRKRTPNFFPDRDTPFSLELPDGQTISAKVCQENSKALMSNPNSTLGKWLLRDVFHIQENKLLTYSFLQSIDIDSVRIEKLSDGLYKIDFAKVDSYEDWMQGFRVDDPED